MSKYKQNGAALFVSLMFLFLMTIIGVSALNSSTSDERMALNAQHQQQVFHAADSAINVIKHDINALEQAIITGAFGPVTYTAQTHVTATANINYAGCADPPAGYDVEKFVNQDFDVDSSAQMVNAGAQADHLQGIAQVAPKAATSC